MNSDRKAFLGLLIAFVSLVHLSGQELNQIDPNHTDVGGYGYLLSNDDRCAVWWAEGNYKVMKNAPVPGNNKESITLHSAGNEYEPFILVLSPKQRMDQVRIKTTELKSKTGEIISEELITVRRVEYVNITHFPDNDKTYSFKGLWPDPLPLCEGTLTIHSNENCPYWITVKVPAGTTPGFYGGKISVSSGQWRHTYPVSIEVWDFELPEKTTMRSGFGLDIETIKQYHNTDTKEDLKQVFDLYMQAFRDYKISPYNPFEVSPFQEKISGIEWTGGVFDVHEKYSGKYAYRVEDISANVDASAETRNLVRVDHTKNYNLSFQSRTLEEKQNYCVLIKCYDIERKGIIFENRLKIFSGSRKWESGSLSMGALHPEIYYISVHLFPVLHTYSGEHKGIAWFDEVKLYDTGDNENILIQGDFETNVADINITLDFTEFDKAGKRYLDEFGFNSFRIRLHKYLGEGTFYSRQSGVFEGFEQGSEEYNKLIKRFLSLFENHLVEMGWIGKEYIYWFDEPDKDDYDFVREGMNNIRAAAPRLKRFITRGYDLTDAAEIICPPIHRVDPGLGAELNEEGKEYWSYLCCNPKSPWVNLFIEHDAVNLRLWLWMSYKYNLSGILIWRLNYWNSDVASPKGYLQSPWQQPMSFVSHYGTPYEQQRMWGNGDGYFFYPPNQNPNEDKSKYVEGPVPTIRLEIMRQGIEDYEYLVLLENAVRKASKKNEYKDIIAEAQSILDIPEDIFVDGTDYNKDPQIYYTYRKRIAELILRINQ